MQRNLYWGTSCLKIILCRSTRTKIPTNWVRDTDDAVINHEIHYDVLFARTKHSYINNYPVKFALFNYSVRDILLDRPYRHSGDTRSLRLWTDVWFCTVELSVVRFAREEKRALILLCPVDTVHNCARAQSTRCSVALVCDWIVLSWWCTINLMLNSLVPNCSKNGVSNRSGAHLYLCTIESCPIGRAQSIRCTNDRCSSSLWTLCSVSMVHSRIYMCS